MMTRKIIIAIIIVILIIAAAWFLGAGPTAEKTEIVPVSDSESDFLELEAEERADDAFFAEIDNELQGL